MAKYNWETIKRQYTRGIKQEDGTKHYPSQPELCEMHGCSSGAIGTQASKGKWEAERERYKSKVEKKSEEKQSEIEAEEIVEDDLLCESFGRKALRVADKKLSKLEQKLDDNKWVSGIDILNTVNSGKGAQDIIKTAQGEANNISKIEGTFETNVDLLNDPEYIQSKAKAMDEYYAKRRKK